ncbi:hypothetical protein GETHPA_04520 [Geothrix rubra]|uniref:Uncharacterized protein n=1 Tax=Geothrix rubra TaxID=2927977 RepID=A0ABQ5Q2J8_9BACT|nr:hypothetical protein [Geothrix rubra]GLH68919.1 hypothetical protein GETHPA_04520 [Geothrix rubra]
MAETLERRHHWSRIVGVERRQAPFHYLNGRPLPDPTRLEDEDFLRAEREREKDRKLTRNPWEEPDRS